LTVRQTFYEHCQRSKLSCATHWIDLRQSSIRPRTEKWL